MSIKIELNTGYNEDTVVGLMREVGVVVCIVIWKRLFLFKRIPWCNKKTTFHEPLQKYFKSEFPSMSFDSEAEKILLEVFQEKSYIVNKRKTEA